MYLSSTGTRTHVSHISGSNFDLLNYFSLWKKVSNKLLIYMASFDSFYVRVFQLVWTNKIRKVTDTSFCALHWISGACLILPLVWVNY
jgi:hypothetical protein